MVALNINLDVGNIDPFCPYCQRELEKKPLSKKKCPCCGKDIYVRTRPSDRKRILVTLDQLPIVEDL